MNAASSVTASLHIYHHIQCWSFHLKFQQYSGSSAQRAVRAVNAHAARVHPSFFVQIATHCGERAKSSFTLSLSYHSFPQAWTGAAACTALAQNVQEGCAQQCFANWR